MNFSSPIGRAFSQVVSGVTVVSLLGASGFAVTAKELKQQKADIADLDREIRELRARIKTNEDLIFKLQLPDVPGQVPSQTGSKGAVKRALGSGDATLGGECHSTCVAGSTGGNSGRCSPDDENLLKTKLSTQALPSSDLCLTYFEKIADYSGASSGLTQACKDAIGSCSKVYKKEEPIRKKAENEIILSRIRMLEDRKISVQESADNGYCEDCHLQNRGFSYGAYGAFGAYGGAGAGGGAFSDRNPTTGEMIVAGLGMLAPVAMSGMALGMGAMQLNAQQDMYLAYLNQCQNVGVPCSTPGMMGGMGMMGYGMGMGMPMGGLMGGPMGGPMGGMMGGYGMGMPMAGGMGFGGALVGGFGGIGMPMGGMGMMPMMNPMMMPMMGGYGMGMPMAGGMGFGGAIVGIGGGMGGMGMGMPMMGGMGMMYPGGMMPGMGGMGMMPGMGGMGFGGAIVGGYGGMGMMPGMGGMGMMPGMGGAIVGIGGFGGMGAGGMAPNMAPMMGGLYSSLGMNNPQYLNGMNLSMQGALLSQQYAMQQQSDAMIAQQEAARAVQRVYQLQGMGMGGYGMGMGGFGVGVSGGVYSPGFNAGSPNLGAPGAPNSPYMIK